MSANIMCTLVLCVGFFVSLQHTQQQTLTGVYAPRFVHVWRRTANNNWWLWWSSSRRRRQRAAGIVATQTAVRDVKCTRIDVCVCVGWGTRREGGSRCCANASAASSTTLLSAVSDALRVWAVEIDGGYRTDDAGPSEREMHCRTVLLDVSLHTN